MLKLNEKAKISIYDLAGRLVYQSPTPEKQIKLHLP